MAPDRRELRIVLTIVFLGYLGISVPFLIFPPLFLNPLFAFLPADWGAAPRALLLGITLGAYPLGEFIGSPILGALSDQYGRKSLLVWSLILSAFCYFAMAYAVVHQHFYLLVFSRFASGFMEGNVAITWAMAADIKSVSKEESFGKMNAVYSIAFLIGPVIGALLCDSKGLTPAIPFCLVGGLFVILTFFAISMVKPSANQPRGAPWLSINFPKRISKILKDKKLRFLLVLSTLFTLAVDAFYEFGPVHLTMQWMLRPSEMIFYNSLFCLGLMIGSGVLPALLVKRLSALRTIAFSMSLFSLLLVGIVIFNHGLLVPLLFGGSGLAIGIVETLLTVYISDAASSDIQGEVMGMQQSLRVMGDALICFFGGGLVILSPKLVLGLAAFLSLVTVGYYLAGGPKNAEDTELS